jgi:hypothetical protein
VITQRVGGVVTRPEEEDPPATGTFLVDTARNVVGEFQEELRGRYYLRPIGGGREWEVSPEYTRRATDAERMQAAVRDRNDRSRGLK